MLRRSSTVPSTPVDINLTFSFDEKEIDDAQQHPWNLEDAVQEDWTASEQGEEDKEPVTTAQILDAVEEVAPEPDNGAIYNYCTVKVGTSPRLYSYLAGGLELKPGDWIEVPWGKNNAVRIGQVASIMSCTRSSAPWPPEQAKTVLGKTEAPAEPIVSEPKVKRSSSAKTDAIKEVAVKHPEPGPKLPLLETPPTEPPKPASFTVPKETTKSILVQEREVPQAPEPTQSSRKSRKRINGIAVLVVCLLLLGTAGGFYLHWNDQYKKSISLLDAGQYEGAVLVAESVPDFFYDKPSVLRLAQAGTLWGKGDLTSLREGLSLLGQSEPKEFYEQHSFLQNELTSALHETLYQSGIDALRNGKYADAESPLKEIGAYQQAQDLLQYAKALRLCSSSRSSDLEKALAAVDTFAETYEGPLSEEIFAFKAGLPGRITEAKASEEKAAEEACKRAEEARKAEEARIQALKDSGIPYVGMPESQINSTRQLGKAGHEMNDGEYVKNHSTGKYTRDEWRQYTWYSKSGSIIFQAKCKNGEVVSVSKSGGDDTWSGDKLLVKVGPYPYSRPPFGHSSTSGNSDPYDASFYSSGEDFYWANENEFNDIDEARDYWEAHN